MKLRLPLLLVGILLIFNSLKAQFNGCDPTVPNNTITLNGAAFNGTGYNPATFNSGVGYQCCSLSSSYSCETFTVSTHPSAIAMIIKVNANGANVVIKQTDCNTTITNNQYFCITGGTTLEFSICTDENAPLNVQFETIGAPVINGAPSATIGVGCNSALSLQGINIGTVNINSTSPGNNGDFNNLLDCNTGCGDLVIFTPVNGSPASITYEVCAASLAPACVANGSNYCQNFTIAVNPQMTLTGLSNQTIQICEGNSIPNITATVTGGLMPYTYFWSGPGIDGPLLQNSNTISNLSEGTYTLTVIDDAGCSTSTLSTTYDVIPIPVVSAGPDLAFCAPSNSISIQGTSTPECNLNWTGGLGSFSPSNGQTTVYTPDPAELVSGSFNLTLTGTNICGTSTDNVQITFYTLNGLTVNSSVTNVVCFGASTGAIDITIPNGSGNYSFLWSNGATSEDLTGLNAGTYVLQINDLTYGCSDNISVNITHINPGPVFTISSNKVDPTCFGQSNGSISTTLIGGNGPYTYVWDNGLGSSPNLNGLSGGSYTLTVTDNNGCIATLNETLNTPQQIVITESVANISCFGFQDGAIDVSISGGTPTYNINWTPGNITTEDLTGLSSGSYTITVQDQNACTASETYTINEPTLLSASNTVTTPSCYGATDGAVNITPNGGTPSYTYAWNNAANTEDLSNLSAGTYILTLTDANGCSAIIPVTVNQPQEIDLSTSSTNISCFGLTDGSASVIATGGDGNFTYLWSITNQTISSIANLSANTYNVTVTDGTGCSETASVTITEPLQLISNSIINSNILCNGGVGVITVSATGGIQPYSNVGNFTVNSGTYTYVVEDANDCQSSTTITITEPSAISATSSNTNVLCNGASTGAIDLSISGGTAPYTQLWNNAATTEDLTGLAAGTYSVTITDANGCAAPFSTTLTQPSAISATSSNTNILCNGASTGAIDLSISGGTAPYTQLWNNAATTEDLNGLAAGTYSVTITDANGCTAPFSTTLTQPSAISATSSNTNILCNGASTGAINLSISGGTAPYTQVWNNAATTEDLTGLVAGTYSVTITDANGCTAPFSTTLTQPSAISATSSNTNVLCNGASTGAINLSISGGTAPYTQVWNNAATTEDLTGLAAGTYSVTITDANGCTAPFSTTLTEPSAISATSSNTNILCNGASTGAIDLSISGGTAPYTQLWNNAATTEDLTGLAAGTYSVTITDANGCAAPFSTTLTQPSAISATSSNTNVLCNGASTGAINLSISGGTAPYTQVWNNAATTEDLTGLVAGTYSVTITDANGCTAPFSTTLTQPSAISATSSNTNVLCNGASTGAIDLSISGGTAPYTQLWNNAATTEDLTGLAAGTYSVTITDANGCAAPFSTTLTEPSAISATSSNTNVLCNGASTGAINLSISGGTAPYTQLWNNAATTEDLTGLAAGTYSVTITDANGCTAPFSTTLTQPSAISATSSNTNILCNGASTGAINLSISGGTAPYTQVWNNAATTEDLTGLVAGTYSVTITDANGCTAPFSTTLTQPSAISATSSNTNVLCNGASTGAINLSISGGTAPYTQVWNNAATTEDLTGLAAGTYSVTITDANGCTAPFSTTLTQPSAISATSSNTNVLCNGASTGAIDLSISGGIAPYTQVWSNSATTEDLTGLVAGTYSVTITDANGCAAPFSTTLTEPSAISATSSNTNVLCNGASTGVINLSISGGTAPYTQLWNNAATTEDLTGLAAGTYSVTITDANGCTAPFSTTLTEPSAISATSSNTNILCNGASTGAIDLSISGGTAPYTQIWNNAATTEDLTGLVAGTYSVTITDANGCTAPFSTTLTQPSAISATSSNTNVLCNGASTGAINLSISGGTAPYTQLWNNAATTEDLTGLAAGTYSVTITDANGCTAPFSTTLTEPSALQLSSSVSNVACFGNSSGSIDLSVNGGVSPFVFSWSNGLTSEDITNISAGSYTVTVTDNNNCSSQLTSIVTQPASGISISNTVSNVLCNGAATGSIDITMTGGTGPFNYLWSDNSTLEDISNLFAGTYSVTITDNNNCSSQFNFTINEPSSITISSVNTNILCNGGSTGVIDLTVSGGIAGYSFTWSNNATTEDLTGVNFGSYFVTVIDNNGCAANYNTSLSQPPQLTLTKIATDADCFGTSTGSVDITVNGGVPNYTFSWNNGSSNEDLTAVVAGNYNVVVTDANGCVASTSATVNQPAALSLATSSTPASCNPDGSASVSVTGGTAPYTYLWSNSVTNDTITAVAAGNYTITVTDANGCIANTTVTVNQLSGLTASATVSSPILCNGGSATVDVTATGGTAPFTGTGQFSELAGSYSYTVTDANGCSVIAAVVVTQPTLLTGTAQLINPILCNGGAADIDIVATGGTGPYNGTGPVNGLSAGTYSYNISDANGCTAVINTTINEPAALTLATVVSNALCSGANDGSVDLTVTGGTSPYTFQWNDGSSNEDLANVVAATYTVNVTDANGCVASTSATVNQPAALSLATSSTPASCNPDGSASVSVTGGTAPYTYLWSNSVTNDTITAVAAGNYTITVTDANGCIANTTVTVNQLSGLTASATVSSPILCNGGSATVDVTATGGTAPFTGTGQFSELAGSYSYTVTDANGCSVIAAVVVTQPTLLTGTAQLINPILCNGGAADIDIVATGGTGPYNGTGPVNGLSAGTYSYNISDANGCTAVINTTINEPAALTLATVVSNALCSGANDGSVDLTVTGGTSPYTFQWNDGSSNEDLANVVAATYTVNVTDANGCVASTSATVNQPAALSLATSSTPASCNPDGSASVSVTGGTAPYTYLWSNSVTNDTITAVAAGNYTITVTDANGCIANTTVTVNQLSGLTASATVSSPILCNGGSATVDVTATGGTAPFTGTGQFSELAGSYSYTVTDANGCSVIAAVVVTQPTLLTGTAQLINPILCNGGAADIDIVATGGTGPYNGTGPVNGLSAGTYSYNISDANGCTAVINTTINEPAIITLTSVVVNTLCSGANDGSVDLTVTGGTSPYTFQWNDGSSNEDLANVVAATYTVNVTDANGCVASTSATVNQPAALSLATSSTPASCNPDGSASVSVTGGTAPYTYLWSNGGTNASISAVAAANYTITVTDANGCTANTTVTVNQLSGLTASATVSSPILCNGGSATVDVTATGGTAPFTGTGQFSELAGSYSYTVTDANGCSVVAAVVVTQPTLLTGTAQLINPILCNGGAADIDIVATGGTGPYNGTGPVNGLSAGTYSYNISDANGCPAVINTTITEPAALTLATVVSNALCNGANDGGVDLTVTGGTSPYTFQWNDGSTNEDLANVVAGTYTVNVTDANGCVASTSATVNEPAALSLTTSSTPASCNPDGSASVSVTGGTAPYTYLWSNGGTNASISAVAAANYTITVTDANGCTANTTVTVNQLSGLTASATVSSPILCNGGFATVDVTATGGTAPFTGTGQFSELAGSYSYTVTDANGCSAVASITVNEPSLLTLSLTTADVTCNGFNDGIIQPNVSGGTPGYNYSWSNGSTNNSLSGLAPNNYTLTVTDQNGCTVNSSATISEPNALVLSSIITNALCNGDLNGAIDLTVTGGILGYSYLWNNSSQSEDLTGITAGAYTVVVTDNNGCTASLVSNVNQPGTLMVSSSVTTPITVNGGTGIITVSATGGTPSYTNTGTYTVSAGTYSYTVTDANGCSSTTTVTITEPNQLIANANISSPILCNGGNATVDVTAVGGQGPYTGTGTFNLPAGTYNFTITDAFSISATTSITITEPSALNTTGQGTNITCFGQNNGIASISANGGVGPYSYLWNNGSSNDSIINLAPGTYSVITTDANGCIANDTIIITQPNALIASSIISSSILCNGGNAVVSVTAAGGIAPYTGTGNFTVTAGTYSYSISDINGCLNSTSITVTEPSLLSISTTSTNVTCNGAANGTASITASGGIAPYTYLWSNNATTSSITNLVPGLYTVVVTDANGCAVNASITITEPTILNASSVISSPILCFGGNAVITISATGGTSPYTGIGNFNAPAGTQSYTVTDANGCIAQTNVTVNQPGVLSANSSVSQPILCFGGTGQITVTAIGGTLPYVGTGVQTVLTGTYNYTVTDANGCTGLTSISISEPAQLGINIVGTNPLCNGNSNGSAQATVNGGTAPYAYLWSNGNTTSTATNLTSGTYTVQVTDANGCVISGNVTLTQPGTLTANSIISTSILCNGGTGQVTVNANGGLAPYTGTGLFNAVAGISNYTVSDANGCTASTSINVPEPAPLIVNATIATPIACFGGNGNIFISAVGGTPGYSGTGSFNVPAGTYTYPVTDINGCSSSTTITINQPTALIANSVISTPIACNGGSATILVSGVGGTPNYTGTGNFNAQAGVQSYTVIDANGCSSITTINVNQPSILTSSISSQNVTCNGLNNGSAVVTANGGTPNYSYLWSNGATTANVSNLAPGAYSVTVTDANGCQSVSNVNITQPTVLTSTVVQTANILCFGGTGSVFVSANGGSAPYVGTGSQSVVAGNQSFTITDANGCTSTSSILITQPTQLIATATQTTPILCFGGQATVAVTGSGGTGIYTGTGSFLSLAGNITYTIQDANGCSASTSILITQPTAVTATFNNTSVTCFGLSNGSSVATVTGGTPGYTYLWNTGSTTNSINNQLAGNYSLQVTDANGCIFNLNTTITQPAPIVATANVILPIACFGGQAIVLVNGAGGTPGYSGNGTFNEFAGTHTYVLIDQNGCIDSTTITVTQPAAFTAVASITSPIACTGGQATVVVSANGGVAPFSGTGTFTVSAGTYTYTLIDANGCVATTTINVTQPTPLVLSATIVNPILCHGDSALISIGASGGTPAYSGTGNYLVPAGNYTYTVSDLNGCNSTIGIQITQPTLLTSSVASTNVSCNGANNGSAIVFYSGGTAPLSPLWSTGATSNSINNLAPGNYSVTITDANGCQNVHNLTISQPNVLLASAIETVPIACFNGNATVVVSATGGTIPYSGVGTFFPTAGVYNYVVSDAQGCSDTATITILQPTALTAVATILNPIACFGGQATVNISAIGGVAPYVGTGNINVSAGNQSFTITDANGCSFVINLFINQPTQLLTSISSQNVSCFNAGNGSATVTPIGGTPGYQYSWSNTDTTASTSNLVPGLYSVVVTDTNGCQSTNQVTITQPSQLISSSSISSPVFCFGGNATVDVTAAGGTQPYTGIGSFLQIAGTQTYYVTDANGCLDSTTITVTQPNQLIAFANQTTNVLCFGGTATVSISSTGGTPSIAGTGNYTVSAGWNNFTITDSYGCQDTTSIFISQPTLLVANSTLVSPVLCNGGTAVINISASGGTPGYIGQGNLTVIAGTYTYNVSDTNGCTASTTITITQPNTLQAVANITSPIVCNAGTGVITVTGIGGTAPYTGTGTFTVPAGTYTYPITDANGCTSSVTITINQPPVLTVSLSQINVNCNGFATGSITANPAGGQGPYTYLWSNNQVSQTVSNLLAGSYNAVVTDNLGCTVSATATITQPQAPILLQESHVNVLCFGNNTGSINLSVSGGTSPYTYSWSNSATSQDIQNLIAGIYNVTVTDANGCIAVMSINITQPAFPLTVGYAVTNVSCFGYTDGAIDVTPQGGTGPFTYFWTTGQFTQDLNNIPPGQYIIAITDANNCVSSAQITVTQPLAPLSANITQVPVSCYGYNDGQLTANTLGGTAPYSYVWTPTGQTGSIASALAPGNYIVNITDANGCTASATDVLTTPPPFIASFTVSDNIVCLPSTVTFTNSSIGNFSTALWTFSNGLTYSSNQFNVDFNNIGCVDVTLLITNTNGCTADTTISNAVCVVPGPTAAFTTASPEIDFVTGGIDFINNSQNYTGSLWQFGDGGSSTVDNPSYFYPASTIADYNVMLVVYDVNGCTDTAYNVVQSNDVVRLTVPNAFTPNGDGLNDVFTPIISNSDQVKYYRFEVYNRWGQLIFESNKPGEGWDGKYKGKLSQFGAYNWKVSYDVPNQDSINANGHVTLVK